MQKGERMAGSSLQEKTEVALKVLAEAAERLDRGNENAVAVAWTGGKDSTVVLHLWRETLRRKSWTGPLVALNLDTGVKFPEVLAFRDRLAAAWSVKLLVASPRVDLSTYPVAQDKARCCAELKIAPLTQAIEAHNIRVLLTGIRRDEHPSRRERSAREEIATPRHLRLHPILEFSEMDVWAYITEQGLEYCELYNQGYRSLGCRPCTSLPSDAAWQDERTGRDPEKERLLGALHGLGYF
jgi:phosphoadenosine phosphosulfate reductase